MAPSAPTPHAPRHPRLAELLREIEEVDRQAREVAGELSPEELLWRPEAAWGVGDCLEHLTVTAELYLPLMAAAVERERATGRTGDTEPWKGTLAGRFILYGVRGRRKLPAPRLFRPPEAPRPAVLDAFLSGQRRAGELIHAADGLAISRIRFGTPVSSLLKVNVGEAFEILEEHALRHLGQARRVRDRDGFPAS